MRGDSSFETKTCPRCGSMLYSDMDVCFGCLHSLSQDGAVRGEPERTSALSRKRTEEPVEQGVTEEVGILLRTTVVDVWRGVGPEGASIGRGAENDVVLHSLAVSRRHLQIVPTPDGMEVSDLGAKNPATYDGRKIRGTVVVTYGDEIEVCGSTLVMTGRSGSSKGMGFPAPEGGPVGE